MALNTVSNRLFKLQANSGGNVSVVMAVIISKLIADICRKHGKIKICTQLVVVGVSAVFVVFHLGIAHLGCDNGEERNINPEIECRFGLAEYSIVNAGYIAISAGNAVVIVKIRHSRRNIEHKNLCSGEKLIFSLAGLIFAADFFGFVIGIFYACADINTGNALSADRNASVAWAYKPRMSAAEGIK